MAIFTVLLSWKFWLGTLAGVVAGWHLAECAQEKRRLAQLENAELARGLERAMNEEIDHRRKHGLPVFKDEEWP
jgi:hypothetical protein